MPRYRDALEDRRAIVAHDARADPATAQLAADSLEPFGKKADLLREFAVMLRDRKS